MGLHWWIITVLISKKAPHSHQLSEVCELELDFFSVTSQALITKMIKLSTRFGL